MIKRAMATKSGQGGQKPYRAADGRSCSGSCKSPVRSKKRHVVKARSCQIDAVVNRMSKLQRDQKSLRKERLCREGRDWQRSDAGVSGLRLRRGQEAPPNTREKGIAAFD